MLAFALIREALKVVAVVVTSCKHTLSVPVILECNSLNLVLSAGCIVPVFDHCCYIILTSQSSDNDHRWQKTPYVTLRVKTKFNTILLINRPKKRLVVLIGLKGCLHKIAPVETTLQKGSTTNQAYN